MSNHSPTSRMRVWVTTAIAAVVSVAFLVPAVWILLGSFRDNDDLLTSLSPASWHLVVPRTFTLGNYAYLLTDGGFGRALLNSLLVCFCSVLLGLIISTMAAYALAVLDFPAKNAIFAVVVVAFMVPFEAIAIPLAQLFTDWGLSNSYFGLILPAVGNGLAIFNLRQAFLDTPSSYREAAKVDGASEFRIMARLYVPMNTPALGNSAVLIFLGQWAAFMWPLLVVTDQKLQVAPVALASTFGEHGAAYGENFAGTVLLALIPALAMGLLSRNFGKLAMSSGVK